MKPAFRVIDTGLRDGRANIAYDAALIEARRTGLIPDTIRFLAFPPTALVGRHQAISRELKLDYCRAHGIGLARRITGGGAIYFDQGQLGWELVFERRTLGRSTLAEITEAICTAAAAGIGRLGVAAAFRPRNDIEVAGRKLCGTGGFFDGDVVFFQGTLLIDSDPEAVIAALNVPAPKLAKRALDSAAQRIVTLKALLGARLPSVERIQKALVAGFADELGLEPVWTTPTSAEEALARRAHDEEIGTDAFVFEIDDPGANGELPAGTQMTVGGTVTAYVKLDESGTLRVREALITGDFFAAPPRLVLDLEAALRGVEVREIGLTVERFFAERRAEVLSVAPADFRAALEQAASSALAARDTGVSGGRPTLYVFQPTDAEYLGMMEDHFEGRAIGFSYLRPHKPDAKMPENTRSASGLILLGGGPWGAVGPPRLPVLESAVRLTRDALERGKPVIGIGLGAQLLALAAGGKVEAAPLAFTVGRARRLADDALAGLLPESYPLAIYMRDRPRPPAYARVLAEDDAGEPALFQVGPNGFGFTGHPGIKSAIVEDLILEFDDAPADTGPPLAALRAAQREIEDALVRIMAGLISVTSLASTV